MRPGPNRGLWSVQRTASLCPAPLARPRATATSAAALAAALRTMSRRTSRSLAAGHQPARISDHRTSRGTDFTPAAAGMKPAPGPGWGEAAEDAELPSLSWTRSACHPLAPQSHPASSRLGVLATILTRILSRSRTDAASEAIRPGYKQASRGLVAYTNSWRPRLSPTKSEAQVHIATNIRISGPYINSWRCSRLSDQVRVLGPSLRAPSTRPRAAPETQTRPRMHACTQQTSARVHPDPPTHPPTHNTHAHTHTHARTQHTDTLLYAESNDPPSEPMA